MVSVKYLMAWIKSPSPATNTSSSSAPSNAIVSILTAMPTSTPACTLRENPRGREKRHDWLGQ